MYLLILLGLGIADASKALFTFHNVSINSCFVSHHLTQLPNLHSIMYLLIRFFVFSMSTLFVYLHSIMYLLIPITDRDFEIKRIFTFHNVSINSVLYPSPIWKYPLFTFHNVSINST